MALAEQASSQETSANIQLEAIPVETARSVLPWMATVALALRPEEAKAAKDHSPGLEAEEVNEQLEAVQALAQMQVQPVLSLTVARACLE